RKGPDAPRAYLERAPRVWIEHGYNHPLLAAIRPAEGKMLMLRAPRHWTFVDDEPFRDVYGAVEFQLPSTPLKWQEGELPVKLRVMPSLKPSGSPEGAELWVLRDDPVAELNRFVQGFREDELSRLAFAVGTLDGQTTVVLRARAAKQGPPAVDGLRAEAYRTYAKLPNLYLPAGATL